MSDMNRDQPTNPSEAAEKATERPDPDAARADAAAQTDHADETTETDDKG